MYYEISESTARAAQAMNSFSDYVAGSATAEYHGMVDKAAALAEQCKRGKSSEAAEKIDRLLDRYARRLADNLNAEYRNRASCPSVMICGPSNFPVRKKERQNARADRLYAEYQEIGGLLDKMRSIGCGGIQSGDPEALEKLRAKLERLQRAQQAMKEANAEHRRTGQPVLVPGEIAPAVKHIALSVSAPFAPWALSNNNAEIHRVKARIEQLQQTKASTPTCETHENYEVVENTNIMRLQLIFWKKPDTVTREKLKANGFRWAPSQGAWQRQLTQNAKYALSRLQKEL